MNIKKSLLDLFCKGFIELDTFDYLIDWTTIFKEIKFEEKILIKLENFLQWNHVAIYQDLTPYFIDRYTLIERLSPLNWKLVLKFQKLSDEYLEKNLYRLDFKMLSYNRYTSENFIEKYKDKFFWKILCANRKLSERFMNCNKALLKWNIITIHQDLSENFILNNRDKSILFKDNITESQNLSLDFIINHREFINVYMLCYNEKISDDVFIYFKDDMEWFHIGLQKNRVLSEKALFECRKNIEWNLIFGKLSERLKYIYFDYYLKSLKIDPFNTYDVENNKSLEELVINNNLDIICKDNIIFSKFKHLVDWGNIFRIKKFDMETLIILEEYLNWFHVSIYQDLTENFIYKYKSRLHWDKIIKHQKLSLSFVLEHKSCIDFIAMSYNKNLTQDIILMFSDKFDWDILFKNVKMSENFIILNINKISLKKIRNYITLYQKLSLDFMIKNKNLINIKKIIKNPYLNDEIIIYFKDYIDWENLDYISEKVIKECKHLINWKQNFHKLPRHLKEKYKFYYVNSFSKTSISSFKS